MRPFSYDTLLCFRQMPFSNSPGVFVARLHRTYLGRYDSYARTNKVIELRSSLLFEFRSYFGGTLPSELCQPRADRTFSTYESGDLKRERILLVCG